MEEVVRRPRDVVQKAEAAQLDVLEPGWVVVYLTHRRRFCAFACLEGLGDEVVEARTAAELRRMMRDAEAQRVRDGRGW
ncbi:hypothetical protein ACOZ38_38940 [Sphaerisporangium viridialbum]|uniref:hypothetical protein n=1 Tax=Sphaerisporangium viridialbum TaxID=46189 RepID=UPI003C740C00